MIFEPDASEEVLEELADHYVKIALFTNFLLETKRWLSTPPAWSR